MATIQRRSSAPGVWYRADVRAILQAVADAAEGVLAHVPDTSEVRAYRAGQTNTLAAIATAFGLALTEETRNLSPET